MITIDKVKDKLFIYYLFIYHFTYYDNNEDIMITTIDQDTILNRMRKY